jgi:hypothetical protein
MFETESYEACKHVKKGMVRKAKQGTDLVCLHIGLPKLGVEAARAVW